MPKMKTIDKIVVSLAALAALETAAIADSLHEQVKHCLDARGKVRSEYFVQRDIFMGNDKAVYYREQFSIDGQRLSAQYKIQPVYFYDNQKKTAAQKISDYPALYTFDGKDYKDPEQDGINGNEILVEAEKIIPQVPGHFFKPRNKKTPPL
jgi:hypothetical protein